MVAAVEPWRSWSPAAVTSRSPGKTANWGGGGLLPPCTDWDLLPARRLTLPPLSLTQRLLSAALLQAAHTHTQSHTHSHALTHANPHAYPPSHLVCNTCESRSQPANGSAPEEFPDDPSRAPIGWPPGGVVVAQFIHKADRGNHWALTAGASTGRMEGVGSVRPAKGWKVSKGKNMNGDSL